jgi:TolB-like protein/DNA-binding winged helix-turn-helix (wHTH) protein
MDTAMLARPFKVGEWLVEPAIDRISRGAEHVKLEPRTMRLLVRLAASPGEVLSSELLLNDVWAGVVVGPASVYQAISQLRRALGDLDAEPRYIATVSRKGYRLLMPVTPFEPAMPASSHAAAAEYPVTVPSPAPAAPSQPVDVTTSARRFRYWPALLALGAIAVAAALWLRSTRDAPSPSIVVLPFVDMSADKADQSFCDGMTEELSNWLAQVPTLRVVARTSAFSFKGQAVDVRKIGAQLGTTHVLEGSLRRSDDHMRVTVQLIDARSGYHLWSTDFDRPIADTIKMQEEISRAVADNLALRLTPDTQARFKARGTSNAEAYRSYLLALDHLQERSIEGNRQAITLFKRALAADPAFALAYVGLGRAYLNERPIAGAPVTELGPRIEPLLATAQKLRPDLADIDTLRGALLAEQGRNSEAESALKRAMLANPNDSRAVAELARIYLTTGRPRDSLPFWGRAILLNPVDYVPFAQRCVALQDAARFADAAADCAQARALQSDAEWPFSASSWLAISQGKLQDALHWNDQALQREPGDFSLYTSRADLYLTIGLPAKGLERADALQPPAPALSALNSRWALSAFVSGGVPALARQLLERPVLLGPPGTDALLSAAYFDLLQGHVEAAVEHVKQAEAAPDFDQDALLDPWYVRWGDQAALTRAVVALRSGDEAAYRSDLEALSTAVDKMLAQGVERHGVYELRAAIRALRGQPQQAVADLRHAATLGWRRSFWAQREPQFESLRTRADFRALLAQVDESNQPLRRALAAAP